MNCDSYRARIGYCQDIVGSFLLQGWCRPPSDVEPFCRHIYREHNTEADYFAGMGHDGAMSWCNGGFIAENPLEGLYIGVWSDGSVRGTSSAAAYVIRATRNPQEPFCNWDLVAWHCFPLIAEKPQTITAAEIEAFVGGLLFCDMWLSKRQVDWTERMEMYTPCTY